MRLQILRISGIISSHHMCVRVPGSQEHVCDVVQINFIIITFLKLFVFLLNWILIAECGLSLVGESGGYSLVTCGIFPDQGWNPNHWTTREVLR